MRADEPRSWDDRTRTRNIKFRLSKSSPQAPVCSVSPWTYQHQAFSISESNEGSRGDWWGTDDSYIWDRRNTILNLRVLPEYFVLLHSVAVFERHMQYSSRNPQPTVLSDNSIIWKPSLSMRPCPLQYFRLLSAKLIHHCTSYIKSPETICEVWSRAALFTFRFGIRMPVYSE